MVVALCSIVEQALVLPECLAKDSHHVVLLHVGSSNHGVRHSHILGVVLVVVNAESLSNINVHQNLICFHF